VGCTAPARTVSTTRPPRWSIEIVSPGDETWDKLDFYAAHQVDELLIVDSAKQTVSWLARASDRYESTARSRLVELGPDELADQLAWPDST